MPGVAAWAAAALGSTSVYYFGGDGGGHEDGGWPLTPRGCRGLRCADRRTRSPMGFIERREENSRWGNCRARGEGGRGAAGRLFVPRRFHDCVDYTFAVIAIKFCLVSIKNLSSNGTNAESDGKSRCGPGHARSRHPST